MDDVLRTFEGQFSTFDNSYGKYLETRTENIDLVNRCVFLVCNCNVHRWRYVIRRRELETHPYKLHNFMHAMLNVADKLQVF